MDMYLDENNKHYFTAWYRNDELGTIYYDEKWKCYVWEQMPSIKMSKGCLQQVQDKIKELENKIKDKMKGGKKR